MEEYIHRISTNVKDIKESVIRLLDWSSEADFS